MNAIVPCDSQQLATFISLCSCKKHACVAVLLFSLQCGKIPDLFGLPQANSGLTVCVDGLHSSLEI